MPQYIGFKIDESEYTIPIMKVREIINTPGITRLPQSPYYVKGIINIRGKIMPVVDLKALVSTGESGGDSTKVIVITNEMMTFGIMVDAITSVVNIEESKIEPPEGFMHGNVERVEGVARFDDRLVILLDTDKLVDAEEMLVLEGGAKELEGPVGPRPLTDETEEARPSAAGPAVKGMPADVSAGAVEPAASGETSSQLRNAKEALGRRFLKDGQKTYFINSLMELIDTLASHDYDRVDMMISELLQSSEAESGLYKKVGLVTRKLHNSIAEFRDVLDPRLKKIADDEVPRAVDNLQFVITKTEEAANRTIEIVEKYIAGMEEFSRQIEKVKSPKASVKYLEEFRDSMRNDLTEILLAQEFQDITGGNIKKVIDLVNAIETELIGLIATFGVKAEGKAGEGREVQEKVTQDDVDELLKEFGF
jgi:chemotaxis protein CheZ